MNDGLIIAIERGPGDGADVMKCTDKGIDRAGFGERGGLGSH